MNLDCILGMEVKPGPGSIMGSHGIGKFLQCLKMHRVGSFSEDNIHRSQFLSKTMALTLL